MNGLLPKMSGMNGNELKGMTLNHTNRLKNQTP